MNLFDTRPDKSYGTGGIVNVPGATVNPMPTAGGKWNVMEIEARGTNLIVSLNGPQTVNVTTPSTLAAASRFSAAPAR